MEYNPEYLIVNQLEWTSFRLQLLSPTVLLHWSSIWLCSLWWSAELHNTTANRYSEHYNYFITAFPRFLANKVHFSPFGPSHFLHIQEPRCSIMAQLVRQCESEDFEVGEPTIKFAVWKLTVEWIPSKSVVYKIGEWPTTNETLRRRFFSSLFTQYQLLFGLFTITWQNNWVVGRDKGFGWCCL